MARQRVNPFERGTAEHVLFARWKAASHRAAQLQREARLIQTTADAEQAKADHYAEALKALGHAQQPLQLEGPKHA